LYGRCRGKQLGKTGFSNRKKKGKNKVDAGGLGEGTAVQKRGAQKHSTRIGQRCK